MWKWFWQLYYLVRSEHKCMTSATGYDSKQEAFQRYQADVMPNLTHHEGEGTEIGITDIQLVFMKDE